MRALLASPEPLIAGYSAADLVPFSAEAYTHMLSAINHRLWPLPVLTCALTLLILLLARHRRLVLALRLLAILWLGCGLLFFVGSYATLNWAGGDMASACYVQGGLLLLISGTRPAAQHACAATQTIGRMLAISTLLWPVLALLPATPATAAQFAGLHADPTALLTLGIACMTLRGWRLWMVSGLPLIWGLWTVTTLHVLDLTIAWLTTLMFVFALAGLLLGSLRPPPSNRSA